MTGIRPLSDGRRSVVLAILALASCVLPSFENVDADSAATSSGSGGSTACHPGSTAPCYSGPSKTEGVGRCKAGSKTCNAQGDGYGPCEGEVLPQTEDCAKPGDEDCDGVACSDPVWGKRFGDASDQRAQTIAVDHEGNVLVGGNFTGTLDLGGGPLQVSGMEVGLFVAKLSPTGEHLWSRMISHGLPYGDCTVGCQIGTVRLVAGPANQVFVAGSYNGTLDLGDNNPHQNVDGVPDGFVGALSGASGQGTWSKAYASTGQVYAFGIALDPAGAIVTTGFFSGQIDFGAGLVDSGGPADGFMLKFDLVGSAVWSKRLGVVGANEVPVGVAVDSSSGISLAGYFDNTTNLGGTDLVSAGKSDLFVARFDGSGNPVWSERFGGAGSDYAVGVAVDSAGQPVIVGYSDGDMTIGTKALPAAAPGALDVLVARFDHSGAPLWSARYGDALAQVATGVAIDASDNIVVVGGALGTIDFGGVKLSGGGEVAYVAKLEPSGKLSWARGLNPKSPMATDTQVFSSVALDGSGEVLGAGFFVGNMEVGGSRLTSAGSYDVFVAKFMP